MKAKILKKIKSREEILATLTKVDHIAETTFGVLVDNPKLGQVDIPDWLWTLCGRELELNDTTLQTHDFDYNYFDFPERNEERVDVPVIYFMESWVEDVAIESVDECAQTTLFGGDDE